MDQRLIDSQRLDPGADLKAAFVRALAAHADAGWTLERFSSDLACAFCFARTAGAPAAGRSSEERRLIAIECFDPKRPPPMRNIKYGEKN
jgi:hypothetical protein